MQRILQSSASWCETNCTVGTLYCVCS